MILAVSFRLKKRFCVATLLHGAKSTAQIELLILQHKIIKSLFLLVAKPPQKKANKTARWCVGRKESSFLFKSNVLRRHEVAKLVT